MSNVVNLNKARKKKVRPEKEAHAGENRVKFGRTKAERVRDEKVGANHRSLVDGHKRDGEEEN